jgi:hypothetical protein
MLGMDAAAARHAAQAGPTEAEIKYAALVAETKRQRAADARMIDDLDRQFSK